jgi:hypothetical protein
MLADGDAADRTAFGMSYLLKADVALLAEHFKRFLRDFLVPCALRERRVGPFRVVRHRGYDELGSWRATISSQARAIAVESMNLG